MDALVQLREKKSCARKLAVKEAILQVKNNDFEKLQSSLASCITYKESLESENQSISRKLGEVENQIVKYLRQIKDIEQTNSSLQKELAGVFMFSFRKKKELRAKIEANEVRITEARNKISSLHIQKSELEKSRCNGAIEAAIAQKNTIQKNLEDISSEIQKLEKAVKEIAASMVSIDEEVAAHNQMLETQRFTQEAEEVRKNESASLIADEYELEKIAIDCLGLSVRVYNCLKRANISFVNELMSLSEENLIGIRNIGRKTTQEIIDIQEKIRAGEIELNQYSNDDGEVSLANVGPLQMIEKAVPTLIGKKIGELLFKNNSGVWNQDYDIEELGFSVRTVNCLKRAGITSISEVAYSEYDVISKIKKMGTKSIDEVLDYLKFNSEARIERDEGFENIAELINQIKEVFLGECLEFDWKRHKRVIQSIVADFVKNGFWHVDTTWDDTESVLKAIMEEEAFLIDVEKAVLDIISHSQKEVSASVLFNRYPKTFLADGLNVVVLESLIQKGCIEKYKKGYRLRLPSIDEWAETLVDSRKQAFLLRIQGKTLQECGVVMNLTRERVRQLIDKACSQKPILREDEYGYWYSTYECDNEAMKLIFNIDDRIFNYLTILYKKGAAPIEKMLEDPLMDSELYSKVHEYIYRNSIMIGTEYVPCKRELLCRAVAKMVCSDSDILSKDLYEEYMSVLEKNGISNDEKLLFPSARAFEARMQDSLYILMKYGRKLRYYSIGEYDISGLVEQLNFERFQDIEISTLKLFRENPEVMEEYNIRDEYELHNLLKKTEDSWNTEKRISVNRMPYLVFGNADRQRQAEELLYQIAPISLDDYSEAYEAEYGVLKATAMANMVPLIANYLFDGIFTVDQPMLEADEAAFVASNLTGDFYFYEDVKSMFVERFGRSNMSHLNPRTVKEQGYRVCADYIISNRYSSSSEYFRSFILKDTIFDTTTIDRRLIHVQDFSIALMSLRNELSILEYEDGKYIRYDHFLKIMPENNKLRLLEYIDDTIRYDMDKDFFTIKSLKNWGYDHELHHIGFGDWFNAALVKNSKKIHFIRVGGNILFYRGKAKHTTVDFLRYLLSHEKSMDIYELVDYLEDEYGIRLSRDKIIQMVKPSEIYYDSIMEKVYLDKEYFYEDL